MMKINRIKRRGWLNVALIASGLFALSQFGFANGFDTGVANKCKECHEKEVTNFTGDNTHFRAWGSRTDGKSYSCESCHGSGEKHMKDKSVESIIGFSAEKQSKRPAAERSAQCLTCHSTTSKELMFWTQGIHNRNDVSCASCHTMHGGSDKMKPSSETCFKCHKDVKSQVGKFSHHPIIEGKVGCNDCHNPHGTTGASNIRGDNVNQLCYKCHTDKRGPYLNGHAPVEENCMTCHKAHGSQHAMLLVERQPALCQNCHADAGHPSNPYDRRTKFGNNSPAGTPPYPTTVTAPLNGALVVSARLVGRGCTNCHGMIHGSNTPGTSGAYFVR